ncbi:MAG: triose-phosphate isomerase [Betaproteobacteria bacterium RIFCSPLOWO2_02_FULL_67_26]|nr:MAG: triose-phosphate isomerase [Betaproteobacteria bacterium RIFCSPLOWO2_02_FULL_67_26]
MRVKLVAGNWKMNGSLASCQALLKAIMPPLSALKRARYAVCAPYPYLAAVGQALKGSNVALGAQDVCQFEDGAYTGGVSGAMLADCGCRYVLVGHSERRSVFGETDEVAAAKFAQALRHGLTPILCIGEALAEREAGTTEAVVARQLDAVIRQGGLETLARSVVAYEPVWAIGTGKTATPQQAQAVHAYIRARIAAADRRLADALVILYGGSVKGANAAQLFAMPDVDGGLIGGASLVADEFVAICRAAQGAEETARI